MPDGLGTHLSRRYTWPSSLGTVPVLESSPLSRRVLLRLLGAGVGLALPLAQVARAAAQAVPAATSTPSALGPTPTGATPGPATPGATASAGATPTAVAQAPAPAWVQALRPLPLWSGPDDEAVQLGTADRWDYFQIVKPQQGPRLFALVARTRNYAWVDALSVGPSGAPPVGWPPRDLPPPPQDLSVGWVASVQDAPVWADLEGSLLLGLAPPATPFKQVEPQDGPRLRVQDPFSGVDTFVEALLVGPIGAPERVVVPARWWGMLAVDESNLRAEPTRRAPIVAQLPAGVPVIVSAWVEGEEVLPDNPTWGRLADGAYLHSSVFRPVALPAVPPPPGDVSPEVGRWIDLNLTHQVVVAYEGLAPVYVARTSTGRPGWETNEGLFRIQRRVEKETMDSSTLLGLDAKRADYKIENIRWTQYFTSDGKALHENYWKPRDQFGIPSSHGCVGLVAEDARFFWEWGTVGTPVYSHY